MTYREFYVAVANSEVADEIKAFANEAVEKLDATNARRKAKREENGGMSKTAVANAELFKTVVLPVLTNEAQTAAQIGELCGLSSNKITAICKPFVEAGAVIKAEIKTSKGARKVYSLPQE